MVVTGEVSSNMGSLGLEPEFAGSDADQKWEEEPIVYINGKRRILPLDQAHVTLLEYLRGLGLTGTKLGCGEGGCGACTVMVSYLDPINKSVVHKAVNACLAPLYSVEGMHVITVEGIGDRRKGLHPVQEALAHAHGSQCGFCTPGFVMSMYALLRTSKEPPTQEDIEECLAGNLCRCTGYRPILDAFRVFAKTDPAPYTDEALKANGCATPPANSRKDGGAICPSTGQPCGCGKAAANGQTNGISVEANGHANGVSAEANGHANGVSTEANGQVNGFSDGANGHHEKANNHADGVPSEANGQVNGLSDGVNGHYKKVTGQIPKGEVNGHANGTFMEPIGQHNDTSKEANGHYKKVTGQIPEGEVKGHANGTFMEPIEQHHHTSKAAYGHQYAGKDGTKKKSPSGEPIFPPELHSRKIRPLALSGHRGLKWYRPSTLDALMDLKLRYPDAKMVNGNTEVGIEVRFKRLVYPVLISPVQVLELNTTTVTEQGLEIGAAVTLSSLHHVLKEIRSERETYQTSSCQAIMDQLRFFAGTQIRNVSSLGGNICTASPISDLNPVWIAVGAIFTIMGPNQVTRTVKAEDFFLGYRKVDLKKGEILFSVLLPWTRKHEYVKEFKQAHRRDDDIALVNACMRVYLVEHDGVWTVEESALVFGGVAAVCVIAKKTVAFLKGKPWTQSIVDGALPYLPDDIRMTDTAPGGMVEFRKTLPTSFFFKFFLHVSYKLEQEAMFDHQLPESYRSAGAPYERETAHGMQVYGNEPSETAVGQPLMHMSAELQVTGEAEYTDDVPVPPNALHAAIVLSTKPHARILSIDTSKAEEQPGFEGFFSAKDVPGGNDIGAVIHDEELYATEFVTCVGQAIGVVVANTLENAKAAASKVKMEYEDLHTILDIDDAVAANSYHMKFHDGDGISERVLESGDVDKCFASGECDHIIEGEVRMGGQEHFYLEPNSTLVWTADGGNEVHMFASTQAPQKHQKYVAHVLDLPMSKVVCRTKRIGGGFGGKETRAAMISALACVPAYCLRRPVKLTLDRDVDMMITGQRHAFLGEYKVGFTKEGKFLALDLKLYNNGGNTLDLSHSIMERAMFHSDNVYKIPNVRIVGKICYTHLASNTAFRGFGGPQGMLVTENWVERVASVVNKPPEVVRELNFQHEGYELHYGQVVELCNTAKVWAALRESCQFEKARAEADVFNKVHRWKKRGVSMIPTKFGISFTTKFLNQAGALVQVYTDGSVLVTHGGVEMGQGLHTKVAQIAASAFGISASNVFIAETATDKVPNASPTAASASSDMYGAATLDACDQINARLKPVADKMPNASFPEVVLAAHFQRIDLSAHGFYITPEVGFEWEVGKGKPFAYFTYGGAFAETEIDTLTGDFHLRRVDIVMDLGSSLNPAIDIGQVEGAFIQGLGWVALEELKWGDKKHPWVRPGHLFTQGPGTYKIPSCNDVPIDFRVSLLKGVKNPRAVHSSKAVGEPPFFLASAALFAIKDAILAARKEVGLDGWFVLDTPATPERIRMACADQFTKPHAAHDLRPKLST